MNLSEWEGVDYFLWNIFFYVGVDFAFRESFFELEEIYFSSGVATFFPANIFFIFRRLSDFSDFFSNFPKRFIFNQGWTLEHPGCPICCK